MIRAPFLAALPALLLASTLHAADDPRLVERLYDPSEVILIEGKARVQATIAFEEGEAIENVAIGDSTAWQVTPNKRANLLFIKPLSEKATTNMTVVTDRRTYLFDLVAKPDAKAIYVLRFTYPEEPEAEQEVGLARSASDLELAAATDPYAVTDPEMLNFAWSATGAAKLFPSQTYDDGEATYLTWTPGTAVPAILVTDDQGTEGPVNFAVRGDTIVVDDVPHRIILRFGDDTAEIVNNGPSGKSKKSADASLAANRGTK